MTKIFEVERAVRTPLIYLNSETGILEFKGKSIPENTVLFYEPVFEWIDMYMLTPFRTTTLNVQLDYFNTSSAKIYADLFKKMEILHSSSKSEVTVNWYYEDIDDDLLEAGESYQSITKVPFNLIPFTDTE